MSKYEIFDDEERSDLEKRALRAYDLFGKLGPIDQETLLSVLGDVKERVLDLIKNEPVKENEVKQILEQYNGIGNAKIKLIETIKDPTVKIEWLLKYGSHIIIEGSGNELDITIKDWDCLEIIGALNERARTHVAQIDNIDLEALEEILDSFYVHDIQSEDVSDIEEGNLMDKEYYSDDRFTIFLENSLSIILVTEIINFTLLYFLKSNQDDDLKIIEIGGIYNLVLQLKEIGINISDDLFSFIEKANKDYYYGMYLPQVCEYLMEESPSLQECINNFMDEDDSSEEKMFFLEVIINHPEVTLEQLEFLLDESDSVSEKMRLKKAIESYKEEFNSPKKDVDLLIDSSNIENNGPLIIQKVSNILPSDHHAEIVYEALKEYSKTNDSQKLISVLNNSETTIEHLIFYGGTVCLENYEQEDEIIAILDKKIIEFLGEYKDEPITPKILEEIRGLLNLNAPIYDNSFSDNIFYKIINALLEKMLSDILDKTLQARNINMQEIKNDLIFLETFLQKLYENFILSNENLDLMVEISSLLRSEENLVMEKDGKITLYEIIQKYIETRDTEMNSLIFGILIKINDIYKSHVNYAKFLDGRIPIGPEEKDYLSKITLELPNR